MPNQPKTPARTFRLDDTAMSDLAALGEATGSASLSEALRKTVETMTRFTEAMKAGIPNGIPLEALAAADDAAWLDVRMPRPEADRRLVKALVAAKPFLETEARKDERQRTLREVITRLEGHAPKDVNPMLIAHFKSLLDD
jgi:hypothetical protein